MTRSLVPCHYPQGTVGHGIVQAFLDDWLAHRKRIGRPVPKYVVDEFLDYLDCGDPAYGFTTFACPTGHYSRFVAQCCKGRGICEYCLRRRQRALAHHLIKRVIGNVPVRHAVLCFPPQLRYVIGYDQALLNGGFRALVDAIFEYQRRKASELFAIPMERIHPAAVVGNHRVSANLEPNHHFHGLFPDGVFVEVEPGRVEFLRLPPPTEDDIAGIAHEAGLAFCKVLTSRGFWEAASGSPNTIEGTLKLPKRGKRRTKFFGEAAKDAEGGTEPRDGAYAFHLFVGNAIEVEDRPQLEHLVNYILAPPFTNAQLEWTGDGKVRLWLKRNRHDGTAYVTLTPYEFLDRLADLVPRPNANTVRYYGAYAPNARLRRAAISVCVDGGRAMTHSDPVMVCPICSRRLRVVAVVRTRRRSAEAVPPDTPRTVYPSGKRRMGKAPEDEGQGRLFG